MPVFYGRKGLLQKLMKIRRDTINVEELPPGDLFGQDQTLLKIAMQSLDDLPVVVHAEHRLGDKAALRKIVDDQCFLYRTPQQRIGPKDLPESIRQRAVPAAF